MAIVCSRNGWQVGGVDGGAATPVSNAASLREDYLNQVQRDFLSRPAGQHP